jgi:protein-disulfide isomerase
MLGSTRNPRLLAAALLCSLLALPSAAQTTSKTLGDDKAPLRLQIFTDFACPACAAYHLETLRPLIRDYVATGKVRLTFYVIPSRQKPPAYRAACYANAAARCGHFEKIAEALFQSRLEWITSGDVDKVVAAALSPEELEKVQKEMRNKIDVPVEADLSLARFMQVHSTPTTIIAAGGRLTPIVGAVSYSILRRYLDDLLRDANRP